MDVSESEVVRVWLKQMETQRKVVTTDGQSVDVIYVGRFNDSSGGDFRDAVVSVGDNVNQGCIEIHSCTSGWETHGHSRDPKYNKVVLHVAWRQDNCSKTRLEDGRIIPTVVLDKDPGSMAEEVERVLPCQGIQSFRLAACLERLGKSRLEEKAERFRVDIQTMEAEQALFAGLLEALGYSKNKGPFLELARRMPLKIFSSMARDGEGLLNVQARLLGQAGLLPAQRELDCTSEDYIQELEKIWIKCVPVQAMSHREWDLFKVRPGNYPVRRIIALASLIIRFRRYGWVETWRRVLGKLTCQESQVDLLPLLMVRSEGYWSSHYDFSTIQAKNGRWLLGRERATEIVVNVVLPYFIAWSRLQGEKVLTSALEKLYYRYPPCEINSIQKHMLGQLKSGKSLVNTALRQQGLLHLYKAFCTQGRCVECWLTGDYKITPVAVNPLQEMT